MSDIDHDLDERLDGMNIADARKLAKQYGVSLSREMTLEDIKKAIHLKRSKHKIVDQADLSQPPAPGRWRILVHKTTENGAKAGGRPQPIRVNGYFATLPRNVPIDVPEKVVRALENTVHYVATDDESGQSSYEPRHSFPFQILAFTPGPDPVPGYEKAKARNYRMRLAYRDEFGVWPKNQAQLREAIDKGHIKRLPLPGQVEDIIE